MLLFKISVLGALFAAIRFSSYQNHTLNLLISLEALMLSLLLFTYSVFMLLGTSAHLFLVLLTFAACEAALGLSLLVSILRIRGNDSIISLRSMIFFAQNTSNKSCRKSFKITNTG